MGFNFPAVFEDAVHLSVLKEWSVHVRRQGG